MGQSNNVDKSHIWRGASVFGIIRHRMSYCFYVLVCLESFDIGWVIVCYVFSVFGIIWHRISYCLLCVSVFGIIWHRM